MADTEATTPSKTLTIQGIAFPVSRQFEEGYVLTKADAHVLTQTLRENLRNNFAPEVTKAKEKVADDLGAFKMDGDKKIYDLSQVSNDDLDIDDLHAKFAEYESEYEFGIRTGGGGRVVDPVEREALNTAKGIIKAAVTAKGFKVSDYSAEQINSAAAAYLAANPQLRDQAREKIEQAKAAASAIDLSALAKS